jgi:hypothetical protein
MGTQQWLPRRAADLTPAWLSEVLDARVDRIDLDDIGTGAGIFGEIMRVRLEGEASLPASVIAKFPTADPSNRPVGDALGIYEREVRFFKQLAPATALAVPRAYFADLDPEQGAYVLILEDLVRYEMGDQVAGVSVARAERIIDGLVTLHATWWERPELFELDWLPTSADPAYLATVPPIYAAGLPVLERDWVERIGADALDLARQVAPRFAEVLGRTAGRPNTFLHTDTRLDNFFFDGDDPIFIDWQLAVRGRGPADVAYLLGTSMNVEDQQVHWERLVHRYHDGLVAAGVTGYDWDQCLTHYRESVLYYTVGPMSLIATFDAGNARGEAMAQAYTVRMFRHAVMCEALEAL